MKAKTQEMFRKFVSQKPKGTLRSSITKRTISVEKEAVVQERINKRISKSVNVKQEKPLPRGDKYLMVWLNKILAGYCLGDPI